MANRSHPTKTWCCALVVAGVLAVAPRATAQAAPGCPPAATPADAASIAQLLDTGASLADAGKAACASDNFRAVLSAPAATAINRVRALRGLGTALVALLRYDEATPVLEDALARAQALERPSDVAAVRIQLGLCAFGAGRRDEAEAGWTAAAEAYRQLGDQRGELSAAFFLAVMKKTLADRPLHERVLALAQALGDRAGVASAHAQWADALLLSGLGGAAIRELELAASALRALGPGGDDTLVRVETSLALALRQHGAIQSSIPHYREAITIARRLNDQEALYQALNGLASTLTTLGQVASAQRIYAESLAVARRLQAPRVVNQALSATAWAELERHRPAAAIAFLEKAAAGPLDSWVAPYTFTRLATAYRLLGRNAEAAIAVERGIAEARRYAMPDAESQALLERAQIRDASGATETALEDARAVLAMLETERERLAPRDFLRRGFGDIHRHAYDVIITLLVRAGRGEDALAASEQARARALADLLAARRSGQALEDDRMPLLGEAAAPDAASAARQEPGAAPAAAMQPPGAAPTPAALADLARRLQSTLIEYWIGDAAGYAWVVSGDGAIHVATIAVSAPVLSAQVDAATPGLGAEARTTPPWGTLYRELIAPLERWLPAPGARLTIVPHGPLFRLSFAALRDGRGRYLVERYALHYAPGGAILSPPTRTAARADSFLLVGDPAPVPVLPGERPLPPLPGAREEIARIARIVGANRCTLFTGTAASERVVRAQLPSADVIHLATHAVVGDRETLSSFVVLGAAAGARPEAAADGRLTAGEIYDLTLRADLVVLSACRSARGPISSDGIAGLTRAFLSAGTPSIVAALWDVGDLPAVDLMSRFYREYARGVAKDEALRRAQLGLLADLRRGRIKTPGLHGAATVPPSPAYWAGFELVGVP